MISVIGIIALTRNIIIGFYEGQTIIQNFNTISVWLLFLISIPFFIGIYVEHRVLKILQIVSLLSVGVINILESFNTVYGPGMFLAAWLVARHYGYFDKHKITKYVVLLLFLVILTQISAIIHNQGAINTSFGILIYTAFIVLLVIIIWKDIIKEQNKLRVENKSLKINYTRIRDQLIELEEEQKPYNFKDVKISPAEQRVIKTLTIYKASNREIAERLNIAESTVKLHLYNIYNKIGVDNRFAIIDLCKYNYN
jgi:DNA-binding CsgD family transcriptional regulator